MDDDTDEAVDDEHAEDAEGTEPDDEPDGDEVGGKDVSVGHLKQQLATHRSDAQAARERAEQAEADARDLRLQVAFLKMNAERVEPFKDADHAFESCDLEVVTVAEDGTVVGLREAMDVLAERYPYLVQESGEVSTIRDVPGRPSGRSLNRRRQGAGEISRDALLRKFPALGRR